MACVPRPTDRLNIRCQLRATVFDLPHVAAIAMGKIAEAGLSDRIDTVGGSFFDHLPTDHDVHLLSMILHDWDEAKNRALRRKSSDLIFARSYVSACDLDASLRLRSMCFVCAAATDLIQDINSISAPSASALSHQSVSR